MTFQDVLMEVNSIISKYRDSHTTMSRQEAQVYRDQLCGLSITLAVYCADFYEDFLGAEISRKISEAKESDRLVSSGEIKSQGRADIKAKISVEGLYRVEAQCESLYKRGCFVREQVNHFINSIASRMQVDKGVQ